MWQKSNKDSGQNLEKLGSEIAKMAKFSIRIAKMAKMARFEDSKCDGNSQNNLNFVQCGENPAKIPVRIQIKLGTEIARNRKILDKNRQNGKI